jgi:hypothetical protein
MNPRFSKNGKSLFALRCENEGKSVIEVNLTNKGFSHKGNFKSSAIQLISNGDILYSTSINCSIPDLFRSKDDGKEAKLIVKDASSPDIL